MDDSKVVALSREELYQQVWAIPMIHLAAKFGLSDVGLAKICRKHLVPYPPRGHWEKLRHGKPVEQSRLPQCGDPELQTIRIFKDSPLDSSPAPRPVAHIETNTLNPNFDPDILRILEVAQNLGTIEVTTELRSPHRLVLATKESLRQATPDRHNLLAPSHLERGELLNVLVAKESVQRAMLYFDALIKTLEEVGGTVKIKTEQWRRETQIWIAGDSPLQIRLRERYKQQEKIRRSDDFRSWNKLDFFPSGLFVLEGNDRGYWNVLVQDSKKVRVEDQIQETIVGWIAKTGSDRIASRKAEEESRRNAERARVRREQEQELSRRRAELEAKQKKEREKIDSLLREANNWNQSKILREYLQNVERTALERMGGVEATAEMSQWLAWARQQADRLDPLAPTPASILDERI